jgi:hypothetical protein
VAKWARAKRYALRGRSNPPRKSKLDPYKVLIQRWLERHDYTAAQIFQRLSFAIKSGSWPLLVKQTCASVFFKG